MCRLASFPPFTSRKEALRILLEFEGARNRDGVGSAHIDQRTGRFQVTKYPLSISHVVRKDLAFLDHMPHPGWTIVHLRAMSHGKIAPENTHPFLVGGDAEAGPEWAICHNGIWMDHAVVRSIFTALGTTFLGETDSEVAAQYFNLVGPETFMEYSRHGGVFLALNRDGSLWVVKNSGNLEAVTRKRKLGKGPDAREIEELLLGSTLKRREYPEREEVAPGCYHLAADGHVLDTHPIRWIDPVEEARRQILAHRHGFFGGVEGSDEDEEARLWQRAMSEGAEAAGIVTSIPDKGSGRVFEMVPLKSPGAGAIFVTAEVADRMKQRKSARTAVPFRNPALAAGKPVGAGGGGDTGYVTPGGKPIIGD